MSAPPSAGAADGEVVRVARSRRQLALTLSRVAVALGVAPVATTVLASLFHLPNTAIAGLLLFWAGSWLLGVPIASAASLAASRMSVIGTRLRVEPQSLVLQPQYGPAKTVPRSTIEGGLLVEERRGTTVELTLTDRSMLHIAVADEAAGQRLLSALSLAPERRRIAHELGSAWPAVGGLVSMLFGASATIIFALLAAISAGPSSFLHEDGARLLGFLFVALTVIAASRRLPTRVVIGVDGVSVEGVGLEGNAARFVPYSEITGVLAGSSGVRLVLAGGRVGQTLMLTRETGPRADALVNELQLALARAQGVTAIDAAAALLDRGTKAVPEWRAALRRLSASEHDYRNAVVASDVLVATASDARAPVERRIAAAVVLSARRDDQARERARIAIDGLANDRVRIALGSALDGKLDDEALAEALAVEEQADAAEPVASGEALGERGS